MTLDWKKSACTKLGLVVSPSPVNYRRDVGSLATRGEVAVRPHPQVSVSWPLYIGYLYVYIIIMCILYNHVTYTLVKQVCYSCYLAGYPACQINTENQSIVFSVLLRFKYFSIIPP